MKITNGIVEAKKSCSRPETASREEILFQLKPDGSVIDRTHMTPDQKSRWVRGAFCSVMPR